MEFLTILAIITSYVGVPLLAKKRHKNPYLYFVFALIIGPFAFIPLLIFSKGNDDGKVASLHSSSIISKHERNQETYSVTDARIAICPSCEAGLKKIPSAKTRCPSCKEFMFVRTDSKTMSKMLVNLSRAQEIDEEWAKINGTWDEIQTERERFRKSKSELSIQFGHEASDTDVKWRIFNEDLLVHSGMQNWGLYRNTIFQMSEHLRKEGNINLALEKLLLVCYIDICGPNNLLTPRGTKHEFGQLPFTKDSSFIAPGIISRIEKLVRKANYDIQKLEVIFNDLEDAYKDYIPFTLGAKKAWTQLRQEITLP